MFAQYPEGRVRFVHGTATELDHTNRTVCIMPAADGESESIDFYALVIATGSSTLSPLLGLNKDASVLRENWSAFRKALPTEKSIIVGGGGPTGVEVAGELGEYLNGRSGWLSSKLSSPKVSITVLTAGNKILPVLRQNLAEKAETFLAMVGVTVVKNARVVFVTPSGAGTEDAVTPNTTVTLEDGSTMTADLYIPAMGTKPNTSFIDASLLTQSGQVDTNSSTLRVDKAGPRIYAVGVVGSYARPAIHNLVGAILVLAANIKRDLLAAAGEEPPDEDRVFKEDTRETQLVPIGRNKGLGAFVGYRVPSFMVWLIKGRGYWLWTTGNVWRGKQWEKES